MGASARFEVVVYDRSTETYLARRVGEVSLRGDYAIDLEGLFPLDEGSRFERSQEEIEEWLDENAVDKQLMAEATAWLAAIRDPKSVDWPGGYIPDDPAAFGVIELSE